MAPNDWPSEFGWLECYEKHTPNHKKHIPKLVVSFSTQITWSHNLGKKSSTQKITGSNRNRAYQVCQGTGWLKRANVKCKVWPSLLVVQSLGCQGRRYLRPSMHTRSTIGVNLDILFLCSTECECELRTENGGIDCNYWDQLVWYVLTSRRLSFFGFSIVLYTCRPIGMATNKGLQVFASPTLFDLKAQGSSLTHGIVMSSEHWFLLAHWNNLRVLQLFDTSFLSCRRLTVMRCVELSANNWLHYTPWNLDFKAMYFCFLAGSRPCSVCCWILGFYTPEK